MTEENEQETYENIVPDNEDVPDGPIDEYYSTTYAEPPKELTSEVDDDCLPCQALDHLCKILPEEDGRKACEEIKDGLENDTMTADQAREYLANKVGKHVLSTKLAEVSEWITDQETKRLQRVESIAETIPLEQETITPVETLPPLPEEMTKSMEEIAPLNDIMEEIIPEVEEEIAEETAADDFVKYNPDDAVIYKDLFDTDVEDDPAYMYDDEEIWLEDGLIDDE